ncbi:MAG: hypothetical protein GTO63_27290, partial [Anaerolineae bacterium]|nr:hypothetical protein [Anaerolineae bacterium]NIN98431.1 hypothetical protein [Anaerolineae bacterium]NIQ81339.1 hypothetical protein [Anaerolineae bacterium]
MPDKREKTDRVQWWRQGDYFRGIEFIPGFDDFDPVKRTGSKHGVELRMYLRGEAGVVQFVVYTGWMPDDGECRAKVEAPHPPMPADIGYHSPVPQYEGQTLRDDCELLGGPCYYDGSGLRAHHF